MPKPSRSLPPDVPPVVVVPPPPPAKEQKGAVPLAGQKRASKKPSDPREYPAARDARSKPSRAEIRREETRHVPSRQSARPPERSRQPRSGTRAVKRSSAK